MASYQPWKITPVEILGNLLKHFFHLFSLATRVNNWPPSISGEITKLCNSSPQILLKTQRSPPKIFICQRRCRAVHLWQARQNWMNQGAYVCACVCVCLCLSVCTAYIACTQLWGEWDELERLLAVFPSSGQNTACSPLVRLSQASTRWKPFGQPPHQTRRCPGQKKESWE